MRERNTLGCVMRSVLRPLGAAKSADLSAWGVFRPVLLTLAAVRIARFMSTDKAGEWWIVGRAKRWAWSHERPVDVTEQVKAADPTLPKNEGKVAATPLPEWGWRSKAVNIFDCGFCMTPWLMGAAIVVEALTTLRPLRWARYPWRWLVLTLAGSYVAGHIWKRNDD